MRRAVGSVAVQLRMHDNRSAPTCQGHLLLIIAGAVWFRTSCNEIIDRIHCFRSTATVEGRSKCIQCKGV